MRSISFSIFLFAICDREIFTRLDENLKLRNLYLKVDVEKTISKALARAEKSLSVFTETRNFNIS